MTVQAGEQFNLTVSVTNDAGSVIQEINTFVNVEVRNATSQEPGRGLLANTRFQLLQGQRVMSETYTFAESIVLTVTDEAGNDPALTDVLTVLPGQPDTLLVSSDPHWVRATRSATITTRVEDEFGNGVPGRTVTFGVTAGAGTLVGDGSAKVDVVTDDSGATTVEFQAADYAGISTITVTADGLTNSLEIETALVDPNAAGGSLTNPGLNIQASRQVNGLTVGVLVTGTAKKPQIKAFSSDPAMKESDARSLLLTGTTQGSGESASVYAGTNLTDKLSVGTNVSVDGSEKEFVARYKINRKLSLKTTSSSTTSGGELMYTIEFK